MACKFPLNKLVWAPKLILPIATYLVTGDREDINSISLTVFKSLLEKYNVSLADIGRLEVCNYISHN